ncbi:MAG TPA: diguanylate cyclase [Hyphomicrobiales bacterium]|nr:diguanylate cyclase [Hyphomicrobiales bacterium]
MSIHMDPHQFSNSQPSLSQSAEYLRLALPLMARYDIPVTPHNYAVWYAYVCGSNKMLKSRLDEHIEAGLEVNQELIDLLYAEYVDLKCDLNQLEKAHDTISSIQQNVSLALEGAVGSTSDFSASLDQYQRRVNARPNPAEFCELLDELGKSAHAMTENNRQLLTELQQSRSEIADLQRQLHEVRQQAKTDTLTGLCNRKAFFDQCDDMYRSGAIPRGRYSLFMLDIDHFKNINDSFGHLFGDKVIQAVANVLKHNIKGKDLAVRMGGEEFVVLLADSDVRGAMAVAEIIRRIIESARIINPMNKKTISKVTASIGVTEFLQNDTLEDVLGRADRALYYAKQHGRNQIREAEAGTMSFNDSHLEEVCATALRP